MVKIKIIGEYRGLTIIETGDHKIIEIDNENIRAVKQIIRDKCELHDLYDLPYIYNEICSYYGFMRTSGAWQKNFSKLAYYPLKILAQQKQIKIKNHSLKRLK